MSAELQELKDFFNSVELPKGKFSVKPGEYIEDAYTCIETAFTTLEIHHSNTSFAGYWERLHRIKAYIEENQQQAG
ncbi:DUF6965 family protein [Desertivirga arenae]|uniref:DUF6965 family protein n=1 Tax=Desertivirga arenae TaxID=2810309 RepID=UPI001A95FEC3|nr:hypothetical protein [Pedobacter sp. SYSU D00823]